MMTTTAALLPNMTPQPAPKSADAAARPSRTDAETAETTGKKPADSTVNKADETTCEKTTERPATFEDALKKRLKKSSYSDNTTEVAPENTEVSQSLAGELAAVFHTPRKAPITIKTAADQTPGTPQKQALKPLFRAENKVSETPKTAKTAQAAAPAAAAAEAGKLAPASAPQTPAAQTKAPAETDPKTPVNRIINAEKPAETLTAQEKPAALTGEKQALSRPAETATPEALKETQPIKYTALSADAVQEAIKNTPMSPKTAAPAPKADTEAEPVSSLKKAVHKGINADSDETAAPEKTAAESKIAQLFDAREQKITAAQSAQTTAAPDAAAPTPAPSAAPQVDSIRSAADISSPRPVDQIVQTLQLRTFGPDTQVRMMLAPEDLGAIRITFRQIDNEVVGLLEVQKTDTRKEIAESITQLTAAMEAAGVQIRRIEVVPWTSNPQTPRGEQFTQEFDAPAHQEMYRSADDRKSQSHLYNGFTDDSAAPSTPSGRPENTDSGLSETGLNFFM